MNIVVTEPALFISGIFVGVLFFMAVLTLFFNMDYKLGWIPKDKW